ncbi:MAG: hypothetical protein ABR498_06625, partial [Candidatus Dormibacteria bacterium]
MRRFAPLAAALCLCGALAQTCVASASGADRPAARTPDALGGYSAAAPSSPVAAPPSPSCGHTPIDPLDCATAAAPANTSPGASSPPGQTSSDWSIVPSPDAKYAVGLLSAVSCISSADCWAAGYTYADYTHGWYQTLVEHWDGSAWSLATSPDTSADEGNRLSAITCVAAADCWAAGYHTVSGGASQTLIQHWDGASWTITPSANTSASSDNLLLGLRCNTVSDCWAVGYTVTQGIEQTLAEHWDGIAWSVSPTTDTSTSQNNLLAAITCTSTAACWGVGAAASGVNGHYQTLIERWNGAAWTTATSADTLPVNDDALDSVSCTSVADCWSVGLSGTSAGDQTLAEHWDGAAWSVVATGDTSATETNLLTGVSCISATQCWAVGSAASGTGGALQSLVEQWNGSSWSIVTSPNTGVSLRNVLYAVACTTADRCFAVGYSFPGYIQTLVDTLSGSAWVITPSPNAVTVTSQIQSVLDAATCSSDTSCWAVGYYETPYVYQTLIE